MSGFTATVFFFGEGIERHYDREVIADADLRRSLDLAEGASGGIILASSSASLMIEDDLDNVVGGLFGTVPAALHAGETSIAFAFHYGPEVVEITRSGQDVSFDNQNGTVVTAPLADVLAELEAAAGRYAEVMALVAADTGKS